MIRVLQYLGCLGPGGTQAFLLELYNKIDRDKVQFDFVVFPNQRDELNYKTIIKMGGKIYESPRYNVKNHMPFCHWWNDFFRQHREYHVLHSHIRGSASVVIPIAKKYGVITIAHSHSTSNGSGIGALIRDIMQLPIRYQADYLFACSDKAGKWLYGENAVRKPNYRMIPNGVDLKRFAYDAQKRCQMRQALEIADNTFVLGHIGRITTPKNHKFLVELFAAYHKSDPDSKLLLVGDGDLFTEVKQQIEHLGIDDAVVMTGNKTNTEDFYQVMDIFVFPSLWEGLPVSVVEAQANGLPCLLSDVITHDVDLTDQVHYLPLNEEKIWLKEIEAVRSQKRTAATAENLRKLQPFDAAVVAQNLQKFYLEVDKGTRK